jgi:DNA (cytosine-5)-methyltransferase 1
MGKRVTGKKKAAPKSQKHVETDVFACDLFAGAGGFSLGAHLAGIKVAAAIEWNKYACETYRNNFIKTGLTKTELFEGDITALDPHDVMKKVGFDKRHCDIMLGGPPCQGFSAHRLNDAGVDDPRNKLLLRYFEYVRIIRPTFFLVENVPGLLWPKHQKFVDAFYSLAKSAGYGVLDPIVINARDFGVPQSRRRVFILGYDRERTGAPEAWPPQATHVSPDSDKSLPRWNPASVAFKGALKGDLNDIHMNHGQELVTVFKNTPPNGGSRHDSGRVLPCHENHAGHRDVYGRIDPRVPAPTMTTACINPSKGRFVHPTQHHGITLRQAARIQSFPDWFTFEGGIMAGGAQVGNAVPVDLAKALLEPLKEAVMALRMKEAIAAAA